MGRRKFGKPILIAYKNQMILCLLFKDTAYIEMPFENKSVVLNFLWLTDSFEKLFMYVYSCVCVCVYKHTKNLKAKYICVSIYTYI